MLFVLIALGPILTAVILLLHEPGCSRIEWITRGAVALAVLTLGKLFVESYSSPSELLYETFFSFHSGFVIACAALGYFLFGRFMKGSIDSRLTLWHAAGDHISALKWIATIAVLVLHWAAGTVSGIFWAFIALMHIDTPLLCAAYLFGSVLAVAMFWPAIRHLRAEAKAVRLAT